MQMVANFRAKFATNASGAESIFGLTESIFGSDVPPAMFIFLRLDGHSPLQCIGCIYEFRDSVQFKGWGRVSDQGRHK